ncbi:hypothetical protein PSAB6_490050 [Paraburkholderia sabiae]|nr:hypothetical protein PSAB6_490050 [Paraburkholderia sabiae]
MRLTTAKHAAVDTNSSKRCAPAKPRGLSFCGQDKGLFGGLSATCCAHLRHASPRGV